MPKLSIAENFEMTTRDRFTKVECEVTIKVDGRELPSAEVVGGALEKSITLITQHVQESYTKVPERV